MNYDCCEKYEKPLFERDWYEKCRNSINYIYLNWRMGRRTVAIQIYDIILLWK